MRIPMFKSTSARFRFQSYYPTPQGRTNTWESHCQPSRTDMVYVAPLSTMTPILAGFCSPWYTNAPRRALSRQIGFSGISGLPFDRFAIVTRRQSLYRLHVMALKSSFDPRASKKAYVLQHLRFFCAIISMGWHYSFKTAFRPSYLDSSPPCLIIGTPTSYSTHIMVVSPNNRTSLR